VLVIVAQIEQLSPLRLVSVQQPGVHLGLDRCGNVGLGNAKCRRDPRMILARVRRQDAVDVGCRDAPRKEQRGERLLLGEAAEGHVLACALGQLGEAGHEITSDAME
jgi:hypothetical protein